MSSDRDRTVVKYRTFEVLCYPETLNDFRSNKISQDKTLITPIIFKNSKTGDVANQTELQNTFNTTDKNQILSTILNKGKYNLSTNEQRQLIEQKRREIINYIHTNYLNPKTKPPIPHSLALIETTLKEKSLKLKIDTNQTAESQFNKIRSKFIEILPLKKIETIHGKVLIPYNAWNMKGVQSYFYKTAKPIKENYDSSGASHEILLSQQTFDIFTTQMNRLTDNNFTFVSIDEAKELTSPHSSSSKKSKQSSKTRKSRKSGKKMGQL